MYHETILHIHHNRSLIYPFLYIFTVHTHRLHLLCIIISLPCRKMSEHLFLETSSQMPSHESSCIVHEQLGLLSVHNRHCICNWKCLTITTRALKCQTLGCAACTFTNPCTKSIALIQYTCTYMSMTSKCIHLHYRSMHMPSRIIALMVLLATHMKK